MFVFNEHFFYKRSKLYSCILFIHTHLMNTHISRLLSAWQFLWYILMNDYIMLQIFYPSALRAGRVLSSRSGRAGVCQTCGTHISVTAWWIFSIRSSVELSRPVVVHRHGHLPICPIWACPWAKNLSNLAQIGSRLCGTHISETVGWIDPI